MRPNFFDRLFQLPNPLILLLNLHLETLDLLLLFDHQTFEGVFVIQTANQIVLVEFTSQTLDWSGARRDFPLPVVDRVFRGGQSGFGTSGVVFVLT